MRVASHGPASVLSIGLDIPTNCTNPSTAFPIGWLILDGVIRREFPLLERNILGDLFMSDVVLYNTLAV